MALRMLLHWRKPGIALYARLNCIHRRDGIVRAFGTDAGMQSMLFIDTNWLESRLVQAYGQKRFGPKLTEKGAVDMSSMVPFIEDRLADFVRRDDGDDQLEAQDAINGAGGGNTSNRPVVTTTVSFSSLSRASNPNLDILRALGEQKFLIRNFPVGKNTPVCVPAVALTADLLHACSLGGSDHIDMAVAMLGSPSYLPALTRAVSANKTVFLATLSEDYKRLLPVMPAPLKEKIIPLFIDELLPKLFLPIGEWKKSGLSTREMAVKLHEYMLNNVGKKPVSSVDMADHLLEANLLNDFRKYGGSLRKLVSSHNDLFHISTPGSGHMYTIQAIKSSDETSADKPKGKPQKTSKPPKQEISEPAAAVEEKETNKEQSSESDAAVEQTETATINSSQMQFTKPSVSYEPGVDMEQELGIVGTEGADKAESETEMDVIESTQEAVAHPASVSEDEPLEPQHQYESGEADGSRETKAALSEEAVSEEEVSLEADDIDFAKLMGQAYSKGLVESSRVKRDTLYQLLKASGVSGAKRRLSRKELGALLTENVATVAKKVSSP